jgi:addiction module HigA family antidote
MGNLGYGYTPTHPGEVLKDEIEYRGISQTTLAKQMGMSYKVLNDILNERRPLTTQTAMMFEAALDVPAYSLINIQTKYNMQVAQSDSKLKNRLAEIRKMAATVAL